MQFLSQFWLHIRKNGRKACIFAGIYQEQDILERKACIYASFYV
jgi:hypothetical protein